MKPNIKNNEVAVFALGGLDEIGKNMYAVQFQDELIIIDAGIMFPEDYLLGIDYVIPNYSYLVENQEKIKGLFITHNHEDHIGGIPYLLKEVNVPIYANEISIEMIKSKLREHRLLKTTKLHVVKEDTIVKFRKLSIEFFRTTHSVADAFGICVKTPYGNIVQTGDFKFDFTPVGKPANLQKMARIGEEGVLLLLSDSTNAEVPGFTQSEKVVGESINNLVGNIKGRIIFASFASNLSRVQQAIQAAKNAGRKIAVFGRSMVNAIEVAQKLGYIDKKDSDIFINPNHLDRYKAEELMMLCTGSQGEPMAALSRIANGTHRQISIQPGDTVIFSSSPIPGNTTSVNRLINQLMEAGAEVIHGSVNNIHTSGHGAQEEMKLMLRLMKPNYFMPIHGEYRMLKIHAELAEKTGVKKDHIFVLDNGKIIAFDGQGARFAGEFDADDVYVDGSGIGDIGNIVLKDRKILSDSGLVTIVATIDPKNRKLLAGPDIISRGFVYMRESEDLIKEAQKVAYESIQHSFSYKQVNEYKMRSDLIEDLRNFFFEETERRPMILPVVLTAEE
ncbi:ribonuclease J1 [Allofustis seminis]|uniref:ribonuclease J1 n=1 Tax=Allofustis seminis TaxID=166939 RepID=UPI00037D1409|nr:ribonuclease J [Allofustis seminis]